MLSAKIETVEKEIKSLKVNSYCFEINTNEAINENETSIREKGEFENSIDLKETSVENNKKKEHYKIDKFKTHYSSNDSSKNKKEKTSTRALKNKIDQHDNKGSKYLNLLRKLSSNSLIRLENVKNNKQKYNKYSLPFDPLKTPSSVNFY